MDPLLLKQLGERQLEQLRAEAAADRIAHAAARAPAPSGGGIIGAMRRTTGGALITVGTRLRGAPRMC